MAREAGGLAAGRPRDGLHPAARLRGAQVKFRELVEDIISLSGVQPPSKTLYYQAFELYARPSLSYADAYSASYMASQNVTEIYNSDAAFNRLPGVSRLEPSED